MTDFDDYLDADTVAANRRDHRLALVVSAISAAVVAVASVLVLASRLPG